MSPKVFFLFYLLITLIPVPAWTADISSKVAELEKSILSLQAENQQRADLLEQWQKSLDGKVNDLEKRFVAVQEIKTKKAQLDDKAKSSQLLSTKEQSTDQIAKATIDSAKKAIDSADSVINVVGVVFAVLSLAVGLLAFFGATEFRKLKNHREEAKQALESAVLLARASQSLIQADVMPDEPNYASGKKIRVHAALSMIEELLKKGYKEPALYNWHALALKHLGNVKGALQAAENVFTKGAATEGTYEYKRGFYNKACYLTLLAKEKEDTEKKKDQNKAFDFLEDALTGNYHMGQLALLDPDFSTLDRQKLESLVKRCT
jgi:hypothetical protein